MDCDEETNETESCHSHGVRRPEFVLQNVQSFFFSFFVQSNESCNSCGSCSVEATTTNSCNGSNIKFILKKDRPHVEFDHLSIVSEESSQRSPNDASNGEATPTNYQQQQHTQVVPESLLAELQSVMPPLKHFENIQYENVGPGNVG